MILQKIRNFFLKLKEEKEQKVLNKILEKCSNSSTAIMGVAGSGKSYFLEILSEYQYKNNYSYMLCGNSIEELIPHFEKHKKSDCVLVFVFNCNSTHSIDVNSFFNNKDVLSLLIKEEYLNKFNTKEIKDWFIFFENKENEVFFKEDSFLMINKLLEAGLLSYNGDINDKTIESSIYIYVAFDIKPKFNISSEDENSFIFLVNILQTYCNKKLNIVFDEEKTFFRIYSKKYSLIKNTKKNNYIFTSQSPIQLDDVTQILCFRTIQKFYVNKSSGHLNYNVGVEVKNLAPGQFFIVSKNNEFFRDKPYSVIYKNKNYQDKKVCLTDYINNNNKKMYNTLNKELNINLSKEKKKSKI